MSRFAAPLRHASMLALLAAPIGLPAGAAAQVPVQGIAVSAGYYGWAGNNVDGLGPGPRFQIYLFGIHSPTFALALTGTYGFGELEPVSTDYTEYGLGLTLRHYFGTPAGLRIFADGQIGWTQLGLDLGGPTSNLQEQGLSLGPGVGLDFPVAERVRLFVAGDALLHHYGDIRLEEGDSTGQSGNSGWRIGGRAGFSWAFGAGR